MVVSISEIPELYSGYVRFLSAKLGDNALSEFEKFDNKEFARPQHIYERQLIYKSIEKIGNRGAKTYFFRPEGPAFALPGKVGESVVSANTGDFGIRLYCLPVREDWLLLLNGDIKTKLNPKDCPLVRPHFENAIKLARVLLKSMADGFVRISDNGIETEEGFELKI